MESLDCVLQRMALMFFLPTPSQNLRLHDTIKWKHFPRYWPFVRGCNSPHKGQSRGALIVFFDLRLNIRLGRQTLNWWFETPSLSVWRRCNDLGIHFLALVAIWFLMQDFNKNEIVLFTFLARSLIENHICRYFNVLYDVTIAEYFIMIVN